MDTPTTSFEVLKEILRQARHPDRLDEHPWTRGLFVREALAGDPGLQAASPGGQLIGALAGLFRGLQPATPPRHGLRLDPRWGEFGLLAALYFAPFNHGSPFPSSHLEAWGRIDPAILYFVYGKPAEALGCEQVETYRLVGDELEFVSASTLSDWHRKGLQRLFEAVLNRERYLARQAMQPSPLLDPLPENPPAPSGTSASARHGLAGLKRPFLWALAAGLLLALGLGAFKGWQVYHQGRLVYDRAMAIQSRLGAGLAFEDLETIGPELTSLHNDWEAFREESRPLLWLGPALRWLPVYGGDLAYAPEWSALADHLMDASALSYAAAQPFLESLKADTAGPDPARFTSLLVQVQPELAQARESLDQALALRATLQAERLSPRLHGLLVDELDPVLELADEGLRLATSLPTALGATAEGPKTYLLLVQNEDELRPTGGFITTVGKLVVHNGQVISLEFEGVDSQQEDWSKPYPLAPWQLQEYMNSRVLILRDANWFTDYPTAVLWVEYLYAYKHSHSVDGVIAFDQHFLVMLLDQLGPLEVAGAPYALTADNVIEYMRAAKTPPTGQPLLAGWYRKDFIGDIANALLVKVNRGNQMEWRGLARVLAQAVAERHLLLQFDDPALTALLAGRDWDGALRPGGGDFLMAVDSNIGFNKTSALVDVSLAYDVDLSDPGDPRGTLLVSHHNRSRQGVPCIHWNTGRIGGEEMYPVNRCYWDYLRIYKQTGVELLEASPHFIPGAWMLMGESVPARVDVLEEEKIQGVQGYGTLLVVPGDQVMNTGFRFALPPAALSPAGGPNEYAYRLKIQKQPGTLANPVTVRVHLPGQAAVKSVSTQALIQENNVLIETDLRTDVELEVIFVLP